MRRSNRRTQAKEDAQVAPTATRRCLAQRLRVLCASSVNSVLRSSEGTGEREPSATARAYSDSLSPSRSARNFYWSLGIFAREYEIPSFTFSGLALVRNVRQETASGEGKSRIPSGIEGWAGFLPPAIPAGSVFTYPSRTPGGVCLPFFLQRFRSPLQKVVALDGEARMRDGYWWEHETSASRKTRQIRGLQPRALSLCDLHSARNSCKLSGLIPIGLGRGPIGRAPHC